LGIVYYHLSDYENSESAFRKALSLNRRFAEPYNNLGFLYLEKGEHGAAEEYFKKGMETNLDNPGLRAESMAGLAIIGMKNDNREQAKNYKNAALRLDFRMNDIKYLTNTLKWSEGLIALWSSIPI
jgi:Flp pilus assembly protein TadD